MMGPQQSLKRKSNQTPPLLESITQSESFSGSKGDDGTATELEEKIKSDTATVVCGLVSLWSFRGLCWAAIAVD
nr:hypothetical protein CFP56_13888 [Quercus suber]